MAEAPERTPAAAPAAHHAEPTLHACYTAYAALRAELSRWLAQSMRCDGPGPNGGGEDEANYALAWFPHYLVTADPPSRGGFAACSPPLPGGSREQCHHGYEPEAEAHHGTEPFILFLPRYLALFPDDRTARRLLLDAAEHVGNWCAEVPDWFDYERGCFRSFAIGSRVVGDDPGLAFELAEHVRFLHLALAAYRVSGATRYLEWADRYGTVWARRIAAVETRFPLLWTQRGEPRFEEQVADQPIAAAAGAGHHVPGDPLAGLENLLASGVVHALGDLYAATGGDHYHSRRPPPGGAPGGGAGRPLRRPGRRRPLPLPSHLCRPLAGRCHQGTDPTFRTAVATPAGDDLPRGPAPPRAGCRQAQ